MKTTDMPLLPTTRDIETALASQRELAAFMSTKTDTQRIQIFDEKEQPHTIELPTSAVRLLIDILAELAEGNAVKVIPIHAEVTPQEAADLLNVSRPHLVRLLEGGELSFHKMGEHRRIRFADLMYLQIGQQILARQERQGWGAKVVDRLAKDLTAAFPDMKGFSPRNLKYMRAFAVAWPDVEFVQAVLAQLPWYHQLTLLDKLDSAVERRWYARKAIEHGWSRNVLAMQIETKLIQRQGAAPTIGLLLCKEQNRTVAEYALRGMDKPMGVAEYRLVRDIPEALASNLPSNRSKRSYRIPPAERGINKHGRC